MTAAELHGIVNVLDGADALFKSANRVEKIGNEQTIDDETGAVVSAHRRFAELGAERDHLFVYGRIGGDGLYDFDQLHHGNGIEKMQTDKALRSLGSGGDFGDGERRSVAGKNRGRRAQRIERAKKLTLGGKLLDDGLDDDVAIFQIVQRSSALQASANFTFLGFCNRVFLDEASEIFLDALQPFVHNIRADFAHNGGEASLRANLRDSRAHQATPYDANFLNRHAIPL